ncbi:Marvel domain containing protein [Naviculisporaceae sp. PSN 640]
MMDKIPLILRAVQLLLIVILTALIGNVIATNVNAAGSATAAINFSMFVIVLAWLASILGLTATFVERLAIPVALVTMDAAATLFTFIDAIVLAAKLGAVNCADTAKRDVSWIAYGSLDTQKRCREIQASTVFMWFLFGMFAVTLFFEFMSFRRSGGSVRSGPGMSQVRV